MRRYISHWCWLTSMSISSISYRYRLANVDQQHSCWNILRFIRCLYFTSIQTHVSFKTNTVHLIYFWRNSVSTLLCGQHVIQTFYRLKLNLMLFITIMISPSSNTIAIEASFCIDLCCLTLMSISMISYRYWLASCWTFYIL